MSNQNNNQQLIKEFLDIWQKQFAHMSKDPKVIGEAVKAFVEMQKQFNPLEGDNLKDQEKNNAQSISNANLFNYVIDEFDELKARICQLEKRINELESGVEKQDYRSSQKNKSPKPTRLRKGAGEAA